MHAAPKPSTRVGCLGAELTTSPQHSFDSGGFGHQHTAETPCLTQNVQSSSRLLEAFATKEMLHDGSGPKRHGLPQTRVASGKNDETQTLQRHKKRSPSAGTYLCCRSAGAGAQKTDLFTTFNKTSLSDPHFKLSVVL